MRLFKNKKGFTLIELLVSVGILTILLTVVLIAINPARELALANNVKRKNDVVAILNAMGQRMAENNGVIADTGISTLQRRISSEDLNLCPFLVPRYIGALPVDPTINNGTPVTTCTDSFNTGYLIWLGDENRITVQAEYVDPTIGEVISVTR